jgi:hypothetical protein
MKVGDLVRALKSSRGAGKTGVVVKLFERKIWRTDELGRKINWKDIDPEPVADVMIAGRVVGIPLTDLELLDES